MSFEDLEPEFTDFLEKKEKEGAILRRKGREASVTLSFGDIERWNKDVAKALLAQPTVTLSSLDRIALAFAATADQKIERAHVRIKNLPKVTSRRTIGSRHVGKLVCLEGIVVSITSVEETLKKGAYRCRKCDEPTRIPQPELFQEKKPYQCKMKGCRSRQFDLDVEESEFADVQLMTLQESQAEVPAGQIPRNLPLVLTGGLINQARAGDRIKAVGAIKLEERPGRKKLYGHWMLVNSVDIESKEAVEVEITERDEKKFWALAESPDIHEKIVASIARSIYGYRAIKEAVMYLLFGGVTKQPSLDTRIRGEMNVLLVGDPAVAKSQLLLSVSRIAPRAVYTSGRGSTAAGLTAAIVQERGERPRLEAGALVLADKGIACVDELDKMNPNDRVAIHEAMEQQTITINKWGFNTTLNARTAMLAAANPAFGRYDELRTLAENLGNLPVTILSRFDLILKMRDLPEEKKDKALAEHILSVEELDGKSLIPLETLKKYIAYGRRINPKLKKNAKKALAKHYGKLRRESRDGNFFITPRQLEALVRITEAHARARLSNIATEEDAEAAIKLMDKSLTGYIDPMTGKTDIDQVETGKTRSQQESIKVALEVLRERQVDKAEYPFGLSREEWKNELFLKKSMSDAEAEKAITVLTREMTQIHTPRPNFYRTVK